MRRRKRETTNANAVHGNAFVNGIFGYLQGINETPFYIQILLATSHFHNYSYHLVRFLQISILGGSIWVFNYMLNSDQLIIITYKLCICIFHFNKKRSSIL